MKDRDKKKPDIAGNGVGPHESSLTGTAKKYSKRKRRSRQNEPRPGSGRAVILGELKDKINEWVSVSRLMRAARSAAVHSQVAALRSLYHLNIENKMERTPDGVTLSYYRLVEGGEPNS